MRRSAYGIFHCFRSAAEGPEWNGIDTDAVLSPIEKTFLSLPHARSIDTNLESLSLPSKMTFHSLRLCCHLSRIFVYFTLCTYYDSVATFVEFYSVASISLVQKYTVAIQARATCSRQDSVQNDWFICCSSLYLSILISTFAKCC